MPRLYVSNCLRVKPKYYYNADEMDDLLSNRPMRIVHILGELFIRQWNNISVPYLVVLSEVIVVEMAKGICIHDRIRPFANA